MEQKRDGRWFQAGRRTRAMNIQNVQPALVLRPIGVRVPEVAQQLLLQSLLLAATVASLCDWFFVFGI